MSMGEEGGRETKERGGACLPQRLSRGLRRKGGGEERTRLDGCEYLCGVHGFWGEGRRFEQQFVGGIDKSSHLSCRRKTTIAQVIQLNTERKGKPRSVKLTHDDIKKGTLADN